MIILLIIKDGFLNFNTVDPKRKPRGNAPGTDTAKSIITFSS